MPRRSPSARLAVQPLESRLAPANLTATFSALTHTLTVVGGGDADTVSVRAGADSPDHLIIDAGGGGTVNGLPVGFSATGVRNLTVRLGGGSDAVAFDPAHPVRLPGSLVVAGGDGDNTLTAAGLTLGGGLSVTNGAGFDRTTLTDLNIGGGLIVANGAGGSDLSVLRSGPGLSAVGGSVRVTNGAGYDATALSDLNVGGSVAVRNGRGDAGGGVAG
jgi:large repetitive protein